MLWGWYSVLQSLFSLPQPALHLFQLYEFCLCLHRVTAIEYGILSIHLPAFRTSMVKNMVYGQNYLGCAYNLTEETLKVILFSLAKGTTSGVTGKKHMGLLLWTRRQNGQLRDQSCHERTIAAKALSNDSNKPHHSKQRKPSHHCLRQSTKEDLDNPQDWGILKGEVA